jgi:hypothetical protein
MGWARIQSWDIWHDTNTFHAAEMDVILVHVASPVVALETDDLSVLTITTMDCKHLHICVCKGPSTQDKA